MTKPLDTQSSNVSIGNKVVPQYTWNDLVLPSDKIKQLMEICDHVKHDAEIFKTWSFDKQSNRHGFCILFSGPSGTGKTMAAEVIANELKLDLYGIDLSKVVSKYIGETEKNLSKIFKDVEESNAILFFDEADALFGKRTKIRDAHNRYANIEINYMLDRIGKHKGIVILATSTSENVDNVFLRRMNFFVEFPFPNKECRREIWKKMLEKKTNFGQSDFESLSLLPVTGGNIKSIVSSVIFLAHENSGIIQMNHIIEAYVCFLLNSKLSKRGPVTTDSGLMLIELLAYIGDELSKFQDAVAEEAYLGTARNRKDSKQKRKTNKN